MTEYLFSFSSKAEEEEARKYLSPTYTLCVFRVSPPYILATVSPSSQGKTCTILLSNVLKGLSTLVRCILCPTRTNRGSHRRGSRRGFFLRFIYPFFGPRSSCGAFLHCYREKEGFKGSAVHLTLRTIQTVVLFGCSSDRQTLSPPLHPIKEYYSAGNITYRP